MRFATGAFADAAATGETSAAGGPTGGEALAGEPKGRERLLLALAHAAALRLLLVVVAKHVQDAVRHQVGELALQGVAKISGLSESARVRDHHVAEIHGYAGRQDEAHAIR